ncbi:MAG TPA: hypothetical protein VJ983_01855 [candidate division Zixibacteria bacterium]|nr:hypothetical protein [candidate division Zixibacteria bacterium]
MKFGHLIALWGVGILITIGCADGGKAPTDSSGGAGGPVPSLSVGDGSAIEGDTIMFRVELSRTSSENVTFTYASANITTSTGDFTAVSGTDTIPAGSSGITIPVATIDDATIEAAKTMSLTISSPTRATITKSFGQGTIWDNDGARFSVDIRLILSSAGCTVSGCHGTGSAQGNMTLGSGSYEEVLAASGLHGKIVVPGDAASSNMYLKVTDTPPFGNRMPNGGPYLNTTQINLIRDWINQGAQDN